MTNISIFVAFIAGFLSFFSPCVLPLVPSYILYVSGISLKDISEGGDKRSETKAIIINSLLFIFGFSLIFILFGAAASLVGRVLYAYKDVIRIVGGALIIFFGFYIIGVFKFRLLDLEKRLSLKTKPSGYLGSIIIGITFAAAWTPCAGPIIGSILVLAGTQETLSSGVMLLIAYSFGLAIPFFVTSLAFNSALIYFKRINKYLGIIEKVSGFLLIVVGGLLLTNYFESIITYLALKGGLLWQSK